MKFLGPEVWVTSALDEKCVERAITLAMSLRRVRTAKKLVVVTTLHVSDKSRAMLKYVFDLTLLLDQAQQSGWSLEDQAKMQGLSFAVFEKCVYLSPNALVLKNCDEIFGKYINFAAAKSSTDDNIDTSVYLYVPNLPESGQSQAMAKIVNCANGIAEENIAGINLLNNSQFSVWLKNQYPVIEELDEKYNLRLNLNGSDLKSLNSDPSIVNFADIYPLDSPEITVKSSGEIGLIEKFAVDYCFEVFSDALQRIPLSTRIISFKNEYKTEPMAIVGMSFRLPGGNNPKEFCELKAGSLNVQIGEFDENFFGLSQKEVEFLGPQQRLLLEVTWEAFEDAMIDPMTLRGSKMGMFVDTWVHHYESICNNAENKDFLRTYMGNPVASTAARLSHFFQTTGPSIVTESGCSSSITPVYMACKSLRNWDSDIAVAAGVNFILDRSFDAEEDGFARAEGCVSIIMKRLSDAVRDEDNIWGLIRGIALTQESPSKSLEPPTVQCESLAMKLALQDACVDPKDVCYMEAHETGTAVRDPMDILSINKVHSKERTEPFIIETVKMNAGHTEAVSGLTGIIKVLLSLKNEVIPKHLKLNTMNPHINSETIPAKIPVEPVPWPRSNGKPRIAGVSSYGINGIDGYAIIEESPNISQPSLKTEQERPLHIMKLSAKSRESLDELVQKYLSIFMERLETNDQGDKDFANVAHSANVGRATFNHRAVIVANNLQEAAKILQYKSFKQADVQNTSQNLCFLFTGQGSLSPRMGKLLYETSPVFKDCFDKCDMLLHKRYNISIKKVLWWHEEKNEDLDLSRTLYSQTAIVVVEYCLLKLWESWGVKPDYVMGHSLGEYTAAVAAGILNLDDALMLVVERFRLIDSLPRGKMLVIKADKKTVDEMIRKFQKISPDFWIDYAALNSEDQTVLAGDSPMVTEFEKFCTQKSVKTVVLAATHALHSRHMEPMLETYREVASRVGTPKMKRNLPKYISGMEGKLVEVNEINANYWVRHTREMVNFIEACKAIKRMGCTLFLEVGPDPVLSALAMINMEGDSSQIKCLPSIDKKGEEWVTMLDTLSELYLSSWKGEINWKEFDRFYTREKVKLPFYPFNRKPIRTKFTRNYSKRHPLIGKLVPTASSDTIFQSLLTLKSTNFIKDHVISNTVMFPGAGLLEMCLAGGYSAVQGFKEELVKPMRPILLKNLKIISPFALQEYEVCKLQTIVTLGDRDGGGDASKMDYLVQVFREKESKDFTEPCQWIQHASAKFLPAVPTMENKSLDSIEIKEMQLKNVKEYYTEALGFYEKLCKVGLRYGPKFQSLQYGWRSENALLTSIKVPEDNSGYLIHPVLADAMFQTVILFTCNDELERKLYVPVHINEFLLLKDLSDSKSFFAYASTSNNLVHCTLTDEEGNILAYLSGANFVETTALLLESKISQQSTQMTMQQVLGDSSKSVMLNYDEFLNNVDSASGRDGKVDCFKRLIKTVVRSILKIDPNEPIDDQSEFQTIGIDSLMQLEVKNCVQNILRGRMTLTANHLKDCNNIKVMAEKLVGILEGNNDKIQPSYEEVLQLIRDDSNLLPENFSVLNKNVIPISEIRTVLLTGVTGNLGPYLLSDLTSRSQINKVYCLIRPSGKSSAAKRLLSRLEQVQLIDYVDMSKVEVVDGDLSALNFGLDEKSYESLCQSVDAIVHNAVKSSHIAPYWKNNIRTVNVIGTLKVLEFAAEKKVKHCFYSSSIIAYTGTAKSGHADPEGWQDVSAFDSSKHAVANGYLISKHICEQLVYDAIKKGLPCKAFRFPVIVGDSKTGRHDYRTNHAILRWMACMKIGVIHDIPVPLIILPVDHCSKISLEIFFNPDAPSDVYNIVNKEVVAEQALIQVAGQFGVKIRRVPSQEFFRLLIADNTSPIRPLIKLYADRGSELITTFECALVRRFQQYLDNGEEFLDTSKLWKYATCYANISERGDHMLTRDLKFLWNEGVFKKLGANIEHYINRKSK